MLSSSSNNPIENFIKTNKTLHSQSFHPSSFIPNARRCVMGGQRMQALHWEWKERDGEELKANDAS